MHFRNLLIFNVKATDILEVVRTGEKEYLGGLV